MTGDDLSRMPLVAPCEEPGCLLQAEVLLMDEPTGRVFGLCSTHWSGYPFPPLWVR